MAMNLEVFREIARARSESMERMAEAADVLKDRSARLADAVDRFHV